MSKFKVGDEVTCLLYGEGVVIPTHNQSYLVRVRFEDNEESYTSDGRLYTFANVTLFHRDQNPRVVAAGEHMPTIKPGTIVKVWDTDDGVDQAPVVRVATGQFIKEHNVIVTYNEGEYSGSSEWWDNYEIIKEPEE